MALNDEMFDAMKEQLRSLRDNPDKDKREMCRVAIKYMEKIKYNGDLVEMNHSAKQKQRALIKKAGCLYTIFCCCCSERTQLCCVICGLACFIIFLVCQSLVLYLWFFS